MTTRQGLLILCAIGGSLLYAQNYQVKWSVVDLGGGTLTSMNYKAMPSVSRAAAGRIASAAYQAFVDFWRIDAAHEGVAEGQHGSSATEPLVTALSVSPKPGKLCTVIRYSVPTATNVSLKLYDITGALAKTVSNGPVQPGRHTARLSLPGLARGVYVLKLQSDVCSLTRKLVVE